MAERQTVPKTLTIYLFPNIYLSFPSLLQTDVPTLDSVIAQLFHYALCLLYFLYDRTELKLFCFIHSISWGFADPEPWMDNKVPLQVLGEVDVLFLQLTFSDYLFSGWKEDNIYGFS
jgi:hypothetical protein